MSLYLSAFRFALGLLWDAHSLQKGEDHSVSLSAVTSPQGLSCGRIFYFTFRLAVLLSLAAMTELGTSP